jgi:GTPase SAR1 family protein
MKSMKGSLRKIVVTGPYNAGKSTFVRSLCGDAVSIDSQGTTVVMD